MTYSFFSKAQSQSRQSRPIASFAPPPPQNKPPIQLPAPSLPPASQSSPSQSYPSKSAGLCDPNFKPTPFPDTNLSSFPTPHPQITIDPVRTGHIASLSRITGLLLPIKYSNSFYTACVTDPIIKTLSRVAVYHDHPFAQGPTSTTTANNAASANTDKVIGGIRCRLEKLSEAEEEGRSPPTNLYIQTLHLLSPYRGHGVAASLLHSLLYTEPPSQSTTKYRVSPLVRHYNIRSVTAHVHETNDEALHWYTARGFRVKGDVVKGYYKRLNPGGARIVRLDLEWEEETENASSSASRKQNSTAEEHAKHVDGDDDDDWEKVEVIDADPEDHGVRHLADDGRSLDSDDESSATAPKYESRKRKAEEVA